MIVSSKAYSDILPKEDLVLCIYSENLLESHRSTYIRTDYKSESDMIDAFLRYISEKDTILIGFGTSATLGVDHTKKLPIELRLILERTQLIDQAGKQQLLKLKFKSMSSPFSIWYYDKFTVGSTVIPLDILDILCSRHRSDLQWIFKDGISMSRWLERHECHERDLYDGDPSVDALQILQGQSSNKKSIEKLKGHCQSDVKSLKELLNKLDPFLISITLGDAVSSISGQKLSMSNLLLGGPTQKLTAIMEHLEQTDMKVSIHNPTRGRRLEFVGALVISPLVGLHQDVVIVDMVNFYPNIIIKYDLSPETISLGNSKDFYEDLKGRRISVKIEPGGWLPKLMQILITAPPMKSNQTRREFKLLINSFIGVFASERFKFYNPLLTATVITKGREIMKTFKIPCIGGDTDSRILPRSELKNVLEISKQLGYELSITEIDRIFISKKKTYITLSKGALMIKSLRTSDLTHEGLLMIKNMILDIMNSTSTENLIQRVTQLEIDPTKHKPIELVFRKVTLQGIKYYVVNDAGAVVYVDLATASFSKLHLQLIVKRIKGLFGQI